MEPLSSTIKAFSIFLDHMRRLGWITSYRWQHSGPISLTTESSRSHKKSSAGELSLDVFCDSGQAIGVDLEWLEPAVSLASSPRVVRLLFGNERSTSDAELVTQWCIREAVFKSWFPYNLGRSPFDFEWRAGEIWSGDQRFEFRLKRSGGWVLCVARPHFGQAV